MPFTAAIFMVLLFFFKTVRKTMRFKKEKKEKNSTERGRREVRNYVFLKPSIAKPDTSSEGIVLILPAATRQHSG